MGIDMTELEEGVAGVPVPPEQAGSKKSAQRWTPKRLLITFVAALAGVVGGTLIANAITGNSSSSNDAMSSWMGSYGTAFLGVSHDVSAVGTDANAQNPSTATLRADCARLQADVRHGQGDPPMPLVSLQAQWSVILTNLSKGAQDCVTGIDQLNSGLIDQTQIYFTNASNAYVKLLRAINRTGG